MIGRRLPCSAGFVSGQRGHHGLGRILHGLQGLLKTPRDALRIVGFLNLSEDAQVGPTAEVFGTTDEHHGPHVRISVRPFHRCLQAFEQRDVDGIAGRALKA